MVTPTDLADSAVRADGIKTSHAHSQAGRALFASAIATQPPVGSRVGAYGRDSGGGAVGHVFSVFLFIPKVWLGSEEYPTSHDRARRNMKIRTKMSQVLSTLFLAILGGYGICGERNG
eukprot:SAG25_NODE_80_length_16705_cov_9.579746_2_plen_118_part_00